MINGLPSFSLRFRQGALVGLGCLGTVACQREDSLNPYPKASAYTVTVAEAKLAAANIASYPTVVAQREHNRLTSDTQRVFEGRQLLASFTPVPAEDGQPGLYFCNYAQGGFAIIAADRHMPAILAFSEHGSLPTNNLRSLTAVNNGFTLWVKKTNSIAAALRQNPDEKNAAPEAAASWAILGDSLVATTMPSVAKAVTPAKRTDVHTNINRLPPDGGTLPTVQRGPFLQTNWGQNAPFNGELLFAEFNGQYCVTGCVATSMAQIMRYWQYPASYQWSAMPLFISTYAHDQPEVSRLMHNAGDAVSTSYGTSESSANTWNVPDALTRNFGYRTANYHDYPTGNDQNATFLVYGTGTSYASDIMHELDLSQPVIFGGYDDQHSALGVKYGAGNGHNWVGDGYIFSVVDNAGYTSFHMNWGWNGQSNGWFNANNWTIYTSSGTVYRNYQYCQDVVVNIHP